MLGRTSYPKPYVEACRARVARELKAFDAFAKNAKKADVEAQGGALLDMIVLGLELSFVHRVRMNEGKDGNPLNEVRMLAASILEFDRVMTADKTIKWDPTKSVAGIGIGEKIVLDRATVEALSDAFFEQIGRKFS